MREVVIFAIVLLLTSGCSSEKQQERTAVSNVRQAQTEIKLTEAKKLKTETAVKTPAQPEKTYQPSKARSKQKVIAKFEIGSKNCIINGNPVTMETSVMEKRHQVYVPAQYFAQAISVPGGAIKAEQVDSKYKEIQLAKVSLKYNNNIISGVGPDIRIGEQYFQYYTLATMAYLDSAGIPYMSLWPFAKATGYDVYWDKSTGKAELLTGLPLGERDFRIAQVKPGIQEKAVIQTLGQPDAVDGPRSGLTNFKSLLYPGMEIRLDDYGDWIVAAITLSGTQYKTERGIAVGDRIEKVIDKYGLGYRFNEETNEYHYWVLTSYFQSKELIFTIENETVKKIHIMDAVVS